MTTPEQPDPAAVERDDALLDAVASGAPVDDPAAALLAEIARAAEDAPPRGPSGEDGGGRRIRTIFGTTLGLSVAVALGSATRTATVPETGEVTLLV